MWQTYFQAALAAGAKQDPRTAEKMFNLAVNQAEAFGERDVRFIKSMEGLGLTYMTEGKFTESEAVLQRVLSLKKASFGVNHPEYALTEGNLGDLYLEEANFDEAEKAYKAALQILPPNTMAYEQKLQHLGHLYLRQTRWNDAEQTFKQVADLKTKRVGANDPTLEETWLAMGELNTQKGNYAEAERYCNRALDMAQRNGNPNDMMLWSARTDLAVIYWRQGKYRQAEPLLKSTLEVMEKKFGENSTQVSRCLCNLGYIYKEERRYDQAEPLFQRALKIAEATTPDHPSEALILRDLGELYLEQGKYDQAEPLLKRSLAIREKAYGQDHLEVAQSSNTLGQLFIQQGRYTEAEESLKRALAIYKTTIGESHQDYATALANLGLLYLDEHKYGVAEPFMKQALATRERVLPAEHPDIAVSLSQLAGLYRDNGQMKQAEQFYRKLLQRDQKYSGDGSAAVASDLDNLAKVASASHNTGESTALSARSLAIKKKLPGFSSAAVKPVNAPAAVSSESFRDKWALCIGISNFKDESINLKYAAKDATDFNNFLVNEGNFKADHVRLLTDADATRDNIVDQLGDKWLGRTARPEDLVVIYISSHGSSALQEAGGTNFLVAYDTNKSSLLATGIPMQWLCQIIKEQVHSSRIVLMLDVCHAGSAAGLGEKGIERQHGIDVSNLPLGSGQILLCSCAPEQVSWESKEYPNSVFTRRLIEGMRSRGIATTLTTAYDWLRDKVEEEVLRDRGQIQTPLMKKIWQGSDPAPLVVPEGLSARP